MGLVVLVIQVSIHEGVFAVDFTNSFWPAGRSVLEGNFHYDPHLRPPDPFVYPPLTAAIFAPIAVLPSALAGGLYTAAGVLGVLFALRSFGVRDWRCYGAAFLWPPVLSAIQAANLTLLLLGAIGLVWHIRDRTPIALVQQSLNWLWLVPIVTLFCPGKGTGTLDQATLGLAVIAFVAIAVTSPLGRMGRGRAAQA